MSNTLIPAEAFEVRPLKGYRIPVPGGSIPLKGWGVWDKRAEAWVSMHKDGQVSEWTLKRQAQAVISEGLYDSYGLAKPPERMDSPRRR